jgi:16S rRNA G966 N2-methylase RsmD
MRTNLGTTGLADRAAVHQSDAVRFVERLDSAGSAPDTRPRYDLVILDPPYGDAAMLAALEVLGRGAVLTPEAIVVAKHFWRDAPPDRVGLLHTSRDAKRFGETALTFYVHGTGASDR